MMPNNCVTYDCKVNYTISFSTASNYTEKEHNNKKTNRRILSLYDSVKPYQSKSDNYMGSDIEYGKSLSRYSRTISVENIKILQHLESKEDKYFFLDEGGNASVYLASKFEYHNQETTSKLSNKKNYKGFFLKRNKGNHYLLNISKLGVVKDFFIEDNTMEELKNTIHNAEEELKYTKKAGIPARLFVDEDNRIIRLIFEYKGDSLNHYVLSHSDIKVYDVEASSNKIVDVSNKCYKLTRLIIRQLLEQVANFHQKANCIHGDIKSSNVVVNQAGEAFLIDFGGTLPLKDKGYVNIDHILCTRSYLPPEFFTTHSKFIKGKKLDSWCLGLTFLHVILGKFVFFAVKDEFNDYHFREKLYDKYMDELKSQTDIPRDIKSIVIGLLEQKPKRRLSVAGALKLISIDKKLCMKNNLELEFEKHKAAKDLLENQKAIIRICGSGAETNRIVEFIDEKTTKRLSGLLEQENKLKKRLSLLSAIAKLKIN